jgi:hypothetical protein
MAHAELGSRVPALAIEKQAGYRCGKVCATKDRVTWLTWLIVALLVATFAALTGIKPKESRPVAHTRLMGVARIVLVVAVLIVAYMAYRARSGA